ncbi:MAG: polysaccharide deacetylase family protein [Firmicutes bacterium]|nr:polysaccharide deacetylase family protein [Bacillota bacterium]
MKRICMAMVLMICIVMNVGTVSASGGETRGFAWYCKNNTTHTQPELPSEFSFIHESDAYYLNPNVSDDDKVIYLTFDAGYENGNIEKILDAMKSRGVTGAFFILGNIIERNTDLVKRMKDEGHLVCNHTFSHKDMTRVTSADVFGTELEKLEKYYKEMTGNELDKFYRPPKGCFTESNLKNAKALGYKTIFWSYAYADWDNDKQMPAEKAYEKVMSHTHNGEIILLHPTSATNAEIIGQLIDEWKKQGYRFGSLYELGVDKGS